MYYDFDGNINGYILDYKTCDVNGDNIILMGDKPDGPTEEFIDNITLYVQDGKTKVFTKVSLKNNAGFNPGLFTGDFTGDGICNVLVSIDSGGSGRFGFYYIYSFVNNQVKKLFDFEDFNNEYKFNVKYKDNYKVDVRSRELNKIFTLDISYKGKEYLSEMYDRNGKLIKDVRGDVGGIVDLYPIDSDKDGVFELLTTQRITGVANADLLGYVQTILKWNGSKFDAEPQNIYVAILGSEIRE